MSLFRIIAKLGIDSSEFNSGLKQASKAAESSMVSSMASVGKSVASAFAIGAIANFSRSVVQAAADVKDLSGQFEESTDNIQAMQVAAKEAGVEINTLGAILARIKKAQAEVVSGDKNATQLFERLGIKPGMSAISIMRSLPEARDRAAAIELIGSKNQKAFSAIRGIRELGDSEKFSEEFIDQADRYDDAAHRFSRGWKVLASRLFSGTVGNLMEFGDQWGAGYKESFAQQRGGGEDKIKQYLNAMMEHYQYMFFGGGGAFKKGVEDYVAGKWGGAGDSMVPGRVPYARDSGEVMGAPAGIARSTDEYAGPTDAEALLAIIRNAKIGRQYSTLDDLEKIRGRKFSPISMGDRANIGGFFGPNADLNQKLVRLTSDVTKIANATTRMAEALEPK